MYNTLLVFALGAAIIYPAKYAGISEYALARQKVLGQKVVPAPPEPLPKPDPDKKICPFCNNTGKVKMVDGNWSECPNPECPIKKAREAAEKERREQLAREKEEAARLEKERAEKAAAEAAAKKPVLTFNPQSPMQVVVDGVAYQRKPPALPANAWNGAQTYQWLNKTTFKVCYGAYGCRVFNIENRDDKLMLTPELYKGQ